ncbi:MAG TPA: hypothetical protein PKC76_09000 [Saprospiraceae bacterium]|nr:hypothetical protein [Saprospiraceae bacterium]HMP24256.1 hypothetical protein [Saprospiraceae bacterium]
MEFKDVIGQDTVKQLLRQMVRNDRTPHALLLLGAPGSGGLPLALALAQYLLCENRTDTDACGQCRSCLKMSKLIHPDVHFSFPTIGTNALSDHFLNQWRAALLDNPYFDVNQWLQRIGADNKQGNINKEECVHIVKKLSLKTFESDYKILIQWLPEYLGKEGNRLLKIIEEPPANTVFILVAEQSELILNTILSRCQMVKVNPLSDAEVLEGLQQKAQVSRDRAEAVAYLAAGNFNEALQMLEYEESDHANFFLDWLRKCYRGNGVELVKWVEKFAGFGRENQKHFLRYALHFLREYMVLKLTGSDTRVRLRPNELTTAQNLLAVIELEQIEPLANLFDECTFHVERNANPKVLFLDASIRVHRILKKKIQVTNFVANN